MPNLEIRIQSLQDAANGIPAIETNGAEMSTGEITTITFLEGGTASGNTSVMIAMKDQDGKYLVGELTQGLFDFAHKAMQGAINRFGK